MKNWIRRALGAAMALTLTAGLLSGCGSAEDPVQEVMGYPGSTVMFTVNGSDVTAEEYLFWLAQYTDQASAYLTSMGNVEGDQSIWDMDFYNGTTAGESVKQTAQQYAILYNVVTAHGEEGGYTYTDEDKADFQESLSAQVEQMGGDEVFETWLKSMCLTREGFENMSSVTYINQHMADGMYREGTDLAPTPEDLRTYADENDYLAAKHILLLTVDQTTQEALPQEEIDQKRATAEDLLAQLQAITDPAELETKFDELMNQYSEDTGLEANPDGYVFTSGQMVEPFEEGTRALDYGQISDIVESDYGFHIILRLDPAEVAAIRSDWALNQLSQQSTQWVEEAEIVTTETYDNLNVGDFYEKLTTYRDALNTTDEAVEEETEQVEQSTDAQAEEPQSQETEGDAQSEETQSEEAQSEEDQSDAQDTQSQGTAEEAGDGHPIPRRNQSTTQPSRAPERRGGFVAWGAEKFPAPGRK